MGGHLAATTGWVGCGAYRLKKEVFDGIAEGEAETSIPANSTLIFIVDLLSA